MGILSDRQIRKEVTITPAAEGIDRPGVISYGYTSYGYDARAGYKWKVFKPYPCTVINPKAFNPALLEPVDLTPHEHQWRFDGESPTGGKLYRCWTCDKWTHHPEGNCPILDHILIPPHSFVLGETLEEFTIPRDVLCVVVGKSTYARCGIYVNVTPGEPEWRGRWTVEISNTTPLPAMVFCGEGVMQCLFLRSDERGTQLATAVRNWSERLLAMPFDPHQVAKLYEDLELILGHQFASCERSYADKKGKYQGQTGLTLPIVN